MQAGADLLKHLVLFNFLTTFTLRLRQTPAQAIRVFFVNFVHHIDNIRQENRLTHVGQRFQHRRLHRPLNHARERRLELEDRIGLEHLVLLSLGLFDALEDFVPRRGFLLLALSLLDGLLEARDRCLHVRELANEELAHSQLLVFEQVLEESSLPFRTKPSLNTHYVLKDHVSELIFQEGQVDNALVLEQHGPLLVFDNVLPLPV